MNMGREDLRREEMPQEKRKIEHRIAIGKLIPPIKLNELTRVN